MLQMIIYGKIQFLEDDNDGGIEVNNSIDIHKQNKATVETSIWGKDSLQAVREKRSRDQLQSGKLRLQKALMRSWGHTPEPKFSARVGSGEELQDLMRCAKECHRLSQMGKETISQVIQENMDFSPLSAWKQNYRVIKSYSLLANNVPHSLSYTMKVSYTKYGEIVFTILIL